MRGLFVLFSACVFLAACGGGSGSGSGGVVFQGTLTQTVGHKVAVESNVTKHAAGERIENVTICVLEQCSLTDGMGQWGVQVENFAGGPVTVTVNGHGIDTSATTSIPVPAASSEVTMDLGRDGNVVTITKLVIDGTDHTGHTHG